MLRGPARWEIPAEVERLILISERVLGLAAEAAVE